MLICRILGILQNQVECPLLVQIILVSYCYRRSTVFSLGSTSSSVSCHKSNYNLSLVLSCIRTFAFISLRSGENHRFQHGSRAKREPGGLLRIWTLLEVAEPKRGYAAGLQLDLLGFGSGRLCGVMHM